MNTQSKLLLIFTFVAHLAFSQDTIVVKMTLKAGHVKSIRSRPVLSLEKDISKFMIVENLKSFIIKRFSVFPEHSAYQDLKNNLMTEVDFTARTKIFDFDSSKVYKGRSKSIVYCLVGTYSDGKKVVIIDQNGDYNFNNDHIFAFDFIPESFKPDQAGFFSSKEVNKFLDEEVTAVEIKVEGFYDTTRYSRNILIKPVPYNTGVGYPNKTEQELHLSIELSEHLEGEFILNSKKYYLSMYNILPYLTYKNKSFLRLLFRKENEEFNSKNNNSNHPDFLIIENKKYLIASVSRFGDEVILRYSKD
ncbi:hypothetical protein GCM10011514_46630 [Emticicia aquatilis]|uniref:Uncharacterized protein n=1 Tax=Emticicia aquatilis TaxID=1537369 RepID=A0A916Z5J0_9BACT|nr:hypothetical protein [Emticicia aquatilis]GGD77354.1 hypothetical protein GCM10011514_46630 [Emticicia aquatilis]